MGCCGGCDILGLIKDIVFLVVLITGCYSYNYSAWNVGVVTEVSVRGVSASDYPKPFHELCEQNGSQPQEADGEDPKPCPPFLLENIFYIIILAIMIVSFVFSIIACFPMMSTTRLYETMYMWFHVLAVPLLLIGGGLYITSAVMINAIYSLEWEEKFNEAGAPGGSVSLRQVASANGRLVVAVGKSVHFYFVLKLVAASLTIVSALLFALVACRICGERAKQQRQEDQDEHPSFTTFSEDDRSQEESNQDGDDESKQNPSTLPPRPPSQPPPPPPNSQPQAQVLPHR